MASKKDIKQLIEALEVQGFTVETRRNGHYLIRKDGRRVANMASTPSESRGFLNLIAALRRAGFIYKGR